MMNFQKVCVCVCVSGVTNEKMKLLLPQLDKTLDDSGDLKYLSNTIHNKIPTSVLDCFLFIFQNDFIVPFDSGATGIHCELLLYLLLSINLKLHN